MRHLAAAAMKDWDEPITDVHLWLLECRIDHVGVVESEDPLTFTVLSLQLLHTLLTREAAIRKSLAKSVARVATSRKRISIDAVYRGIRDGLLKMVDLAARERLAFWTTGYEGDRLALVEAIRRYRLPPDDPQHIEAPHTKTERWQAQLRWEFLRDDILGLSSPTWPRSLRTRIRNLPKPR